MSHSTTPPVGPGQFLVRLAEYGYPFFDKRGNSLSLTEAAESGEFLTFCPVHESSGEHFPDCAVTLRAGEDGTHVLAICRPCGADVKPYIVFIGEPPECSATYRPKARSVHPGAARGVPAPVVASYSYDGGRYIKLRRADKTFTWLRDAGPQGYVVGLAGRTPGLYGADRLPEPRPGHPALVCVEGEKDVDRLAMHGVPAVSTHYTERPDFLAVAAWTPIIIPDDDLPGLERAERFARQALTAGVPGVAILPPLSYYAGRTGERRIKGYDVSDYLNDRDGYQAWDAVKYLPSLPDASEMIISVKQLPTPELQEAREYWMSNAHSE